MGAVGGVVLHGPAGVGKTRLAEEALGRAERSGRPTARAVGHPSTATIPLGALAHLLPASLIGGLGVGDDERTGLFHGARAELRRMAGDDRLVLLVDDVDLLDDTSLAVLVPLVVSRTVFLIGTVRTGRTASPRLTGLQRDGHLARLDLGPLAADELGALLHRALDHPVSTAALDELVRLSGGNLQVLTELVRGAIERGALVDRAGDVAARRRPADDGGARRARRRAPRRRRPGGLGGARAAGGVRAVRPRRPRASTRPGDAGDARSGPTRVGGGGGDGGRRSAWHIRCTARCCGRGCRRCGCDASSRSWPTSSRATDRARREDVVQVALWRIASGGRVAGDQLLRAARLALAGHDPNLAIRLVAAWTDDDASPFARAEVLAEAHDMLGQHDDVERVVAAALATELPDAKRGASARRLAGTRFSSGRDLVRRARRARRGGRGDRRSRGARCVAGVAGRCCSPTPDVPPRRWRCFDSIGVPSDTRAQVELASARAVSLLSVGRHDEAAELARRNAADHAAIPGWRGRRGIAAHLVNEAHALAYSGRYSEARLLDRTGRRAGPERQRDGGVGVVRDGARRDRPRHGAGGGGDPTVRRRGRCRRLVGPGARRWCGRTSASPRATCCSVSAMPPSRRWRGPTLSATARWRRRGRPVNARGRGSTPVAATSPAPAPVSGTCSSSSSATGCARSSRRCSTTSSASGGRRRRSSDCAGSPAWSTDRSCALTAPTPKPIVAADPDALSAVVDEYEALDMLTLAAEAAAELAELHQQRGDGRRATAAMQRSAELATRAGGLRTPPLARGTGVEPLTAREREVALLAAGGRSSREIADHLYLSTRTVETHLARVVSQAGHRHSRRARHGTRRRRRYVAQRSGPPPIA